MGTMRETEKRLQVTTNNETVEAQSCGEIEKNKLDSINGQRLDQKQSFVKGEMAKLASLEISLCELLHKATACCLSKRQKGKSIDCSWPEGRS